MASFPPRLFEKLIHRIHLCPKCSTDLELDLFYNGVLFYSLVESLRVQCEGIPQFD